MKIKKVLLFMLISMLCPLFCRGVEVETLSAAFNNADNIVFSYPFAPRVLPASSKEAEVMVCMHGYGGDNKIADILRGIPGIDEHLVSFNFPDYDILTRKKNVRKISYGTLDEILPALYAMKKCVVDAGAKSLSLYGFSAGAGAVINCLALLNSAQSLEELRWVGIGPMERKAILGAVQSGIVVLDVPLKSIEEIIANTGSSARLEMLAKQYRDHGMVPIEVLEQLEGLQLNVMVFFQKPDEILSNRDDTLFIERLKRYNSKGKNTAIIADEEGHNGFHKSLWKAYNLNCMPRSTVLSRSDSIQ
jgi:hypothetical protein